MSILIVDDSIDSQLLLKSILKASGFSDLLIAGSSVEAFKLLGIEESHGGTDAKGVDVILMDILMPGLDGIETCRLIRTVEFLQDVPIILVTGTEEVRYLEMALEAGALDFVIKPVNKVELLARVRSAMRLKHESDRRKTLEREIAELRQQVEKQLKN
ncbi:MAG TPA: response regulator [Thermodesulfobacteriota bacterium]|nr:response regulator [Thermodesulfobacteriota bacterium]